MPLFNSVSDRVTLSDAALHPGLDAVESLADGPGSNGPSLEGTCFPLDGSALGPAGDPADVACGTRHTSASKGKRRFGVIAA